jgi:hypothetical protein
LRVCTYARRPFGNEEFVKDEEERIDHRWYRKPLEEKLKREAAA